MKNLKKVLAFVVVFAMMLTSAVSANVFPDVADDANYAEAATILSSLNLMIGDENGNFNPDKTLTRAEATALVVRAKGLESAAEGAKGATQFTDVAADHWATGYINLAAQSGIVKGRGEGIFDPEGEVKYEEFVKMVVAALGFEPAVGKFGGYPSGYLIIASQEGVTKNATGTAGTPIARKTVAQIIFNALEVKMMEQTVFTTGAEEYAQGNKTILKDNLNIDKYEGVVDSVDYASTADEYDKTTVTITASKINGDTIAVEDREAYLFIEAESGAAAYLGYSVVAYVGEDEETGDDNVIFAIAAKTGKNTTVSVDYSQIEGFEEDVALDYLVKETDKSATELELDDPEYYFNGVVDQKNAVDFLDRTLEVPGVVKLVDNDNDNQYEYVFVVAYGDDELVTAIDAEEKILLNKEGNQIDIDLEDENVTYSFIKDGAAIAWEDIAVGDVLTFATSDDGSLVSVYVSNTVIEGTVKEQGMANGEETYAINGEDYKVTTGANAPAVKVSDEGKFYLNVDGRIAFKDAASVNSDNYAYLMAAAIDSGLGGNKVELKFITATGEWKVAEIATRVTIYNGGTSETINSADANTDATIYTIDADGDLSFTSQLFQFDMNSTGLINRLYVVDGEGADDENFSLDADYSAVGDEKAYNATSNKIGSVYLSEATKVFNVNTSKVAAGDEAGVTVGTSSFFKDDADYNVMVYDKDTDGYPAVVVVLNAETIVDSATHPMVITKVTSGKNDAGYPVDVFYGYQDGEAVTAMGSEDGVQYFARNDANCESPLTGKDEEGNVTKDDISDDPSVSAGDVVIFGLDVAGNIANVQILMRAEEARDLKDAFFYEDANGAEANVKEMFGLVAKTRSGNRATIDFLDDTFEEITLKGSDLNFYTVNLNRSTPIVNTAAWSAVKAELRAEKVGSYAYVRYYDDAPVAVVIYNITNEAAIEISEGIE